jgi:hypothetical protein
MILSEVICMYNKQDNDWHVRSMKRDLTILNKLQELTKFMEG